MHSWRSRKQQGPKPQLPRRTGCTKSLATVHDFNRAQVGFVSGHNFSRAAQMALCQGTTSAVGRSGLVSGHDFSRAINGLLNQGALALAGTPLLTSSHSCNQFRRMFEKCPRTSCLNGFGTGATLAVPHKWPCVRAQLQPWAGAALYQGTTSVVP